ncbi:MAG TPA: DUF1080 domain-containing protein [Planctomycetota bacterium]|nr:DUF1080 domain-containing protein [Planctomycetota bacterium]
MRILSALALSFTLAVGAFGAALSAADDGFVSLFDGKTLDGWKINEHPDGLKVEDGCIVVNGERAHVFYDGAVGNHDFKNFHLKAEVMTFPHANSGIYFHTAFQNDGWPSKGYEAQVNNTHGDPKKTAGLYNVKDNFEAPAKDEVWFTYEIIVEGKHVVTKIDGKVITDYTEPADVQRPADMKGRVLSSGTFALQIHDPGSKVKYRNIQVKILP